MSVAIELRHLTKIVRQKWRQKTILEDINLSVSQGEVFGFIGPNGAGKSSTIKSLMGLYAPSSGDVLLFGQPPTKPSARVGVAYVAETNNLYDRLTPFECVDGMLYFHQVKPDNRKQYIMRWLDRFGIADVADKPIYKFSKGMAQRTALAQAMAVNPRLLVLDEPLSGLDPVGRKLVVDLLSEYKAGGGTLFFSSHVLFDVERIADRFGLILNGRLVMVQTPSEIAKRSSEAHIRYFGEAFNADIVPETGGRKRWTVQKEDLWSALEAIKASGGELVDVQQALTLEALFSKELEGVHLPTI
ncbi:ABC transporter ATP-binding protein [Leeia sp. TBRC 13508]|uniref:ABC transporter ATP-binding protein n=1 Tax=Leeia speluncae TaxID=2884804 RepID=A0ABS8D7A0_9NEIS|nr:ABC transporter ATP-binding protein [Leeia speluncae]MCB6184079.1 ABC transporter ATP-binding protein [Leeia speluncae]